MPRKQNSKPKPKSTSTKNQVRSTGVNRRLKDPERPFYLERYFISWRANLTPAQDELLQFILDTLPSGLVITQLDLGEVAKAFNANIGVIKARLRKIRNEWLIMFQELKGAGEMTVIHVTDPTCLNTCSPVFRDKYVT